MNKIFYTLIVMILGIAVPLTAVDDPWPIWEPWPAIEGTIKVLLSTKDPKETFITIEGPHTLINLVDRTVLGKSSCAASYSFALAKDGIRWYRMHYVESTGENKPGYYDKKGYYVADDGRRVDEILLWPNHPIIFLVDGKPYAGWMYFCKKADTFHIINEVTIDDYVASILSNEQYRGLTHPEAIKAAAIAARTTALYQSKHSSPKQWAVDAKDVLYGDLLFLRQDAAFEYAMKDMGNRFMHAPEINGAPYSWFQKNGPGFPVAEIERMAKDGKNAEAILASLCRDVKFFTTLKK